jgi:CMP-N-acetylneuraminic acid synthetase
LRILIIPARAGSKGIPNKNLKLVNGIPLVERTILSALSANLDEIIVSTDEPLIVEIANKNNVKVHHRSDKVSGDDASTESVILEVINDFEQSWQKEVTIGFSQATSPFIDPALINECFHYGEKGYSAFTVVEFRGFIWEEKSEWTPFNHIETGAVFAFPLSGFKSKKFRICSTPKPVVMKSVHGIEIDEENELILTNLIAKEFEIEIFKNLNQK